MAVPGDPCAEFGFIPGAAGAGMWARTTCSNAAESAGETVAI
jgi:hypothetical protein